MKKIGKWIVFVVVIIIILIVILSILKKDTEIQQSQAIEEDHDQSIKSDTAFIKIETYNMYYTIKTIMEDYAKNIQYINKEGKIEVDRLEVSENELREQNKENGLDFIYNTIDSQYLEFNNITKLDIEKMASMYKINNEKNYNLDIKNIYEVEIDQNITIILLETNINDKNFNCLLKIDWENSTYSIFLNDYIEKYNYTSEMSVSEININIESLEDNSYNTFIYVEATNNYIVMNYLSDYKKLMFDYPEKAFKMLNQEYSEKRFQNINEFYEYVQVNKERLEYSYVDRYKFSDTTIYILDNYQNMYIFETEGMFDYKVQLDDYTIEIEEFTNSYNKAEGTQKAYTDVTKFLKMLNTKDYKAAYEILDENFKRNNFSSIEEFKQYAENNFIENMLIDENSKISQTSGYYVVEARVISANNNFNYKEVTFIIALGDNTDFKISFTVK